MFFCLKVFFPVLLEVLLTIQSVNIEKGRHGSLFRSDFS